MQYAFLFPKLLELWAWIWFLVKTIAPKLLLATVLSTCVFPNIDEYHLFRHGNSFCQRHCFGAHDMTSPLLTIYIAFISIFGAFPAPLLV
jgi:hypothetical protein